jgi:hypothetical protein
MWGVLGDVEGIEPAAFDRLRELRRLHRVLGTERHHSEAGQCNRLPVGAELEADVYIPITSSVNESFREMIYKGVFDSRPQSLDTTLAVLYTRVRNE